MRLCLQLLVGLLLAAPAGLRSAEVSFNHQIRPIFSEHCFACHGPDEKARKAGLRLDVRESALKPAKSGAVAIVPGAPARSELVARITATDESERMPPAKSHQKLSSVQITALRKWIAEGAVYQQHWAFEPLAKQPTPKAGNGITAVHPIDALVTAKLREHGLRLSPEASAFTLLRRVTLDLIGLPPTLAELQEFQAELRRPNANLEASYERVVDRLLQSKHYGEHLAVSWLDAARYADSNGYFGDKPRQMWLWRDWVIAAFNANMPFDQFTIEQLAGDLLPDATVPQRIATGFNRNHMANNESGSIDEEFRTEYVVDRVDTTMTTWLGLTAACAQCHDHKFDPISQREFYQLFAFFNNVPETGLITKDNPPPLLAVPAPEQQRQLTELEAAKRDAVKSFALLQPVLNANLAIWEKDALKALPAPPSERPVWQESFEGQLGRGAKSQGTTLTFTPGVRGQAAKFDATQHVEAEVTNFNPDRAWSIVFWLNAEGSLSCPLSLIEPIGRRRGLELIWQKGQMQINLVHRWGASAIEVATVAPMSERVWHQVMVSYDGSRKAAGLRIFVDGALAAVEVRRDTLDGSIANAEPLRLGRRDSGLGYYGQLDEVRLLQRTVEELQVPDWFWGERMRGILEVTSAKRRPQETELLLDYYTDRFAEPALRAARQLVKATELAERDLRAAIPTVLVMQEMEKPRTTHVLARGQYDKPGEAVTPGVPAAIAPWLEAAPRNRLGFARWVVSAENPLTARVAVNRLWQQCFGEGLVRTVNDFGSQGEPPTHPALLDWLATSFRDSGWDVKRLLKLIVMSRTYRQQSQFAVAKTTVVDPENRMLARGPSFRLSAEMLRDQALAVSGLLVRQLGGPSVKPPQPPGLWEAVSYNGEESYVTDAGDGRWRRSLYTLVKRQAPPPSLLTFDGPTREKCTVRRARTNTPLQALLLLNDETFIEAARALGARAMQAAVTDELRLQHLWQTVLTRPANSEELAMLRGLLERQLSRFSANLDAARKLIAVGAPRSEAKLEPHALAAWTVVAQTVLNLDEAITKR